MSKIVMTEESTSPGTPSVNTVVIYPKNDGKVYIKDDLGVESQLSNSGGDVVGPSSANNNAIAKYDGTTGKLLKNTTVYIDSNGNLGVNNSTPTSKLHVNGSFALECVQKTANYTLNEEVMVNADATSGNITITLPLISSVTDRTYVIKKYDSSSNHVIVVPSGSDTIEYGTSVKLLQQGDAICIQACVTGMWSIIASPKLKAIYGQFSSTASQQPSTTSPTLVTLNQNDDVSGITHSTSVNSDRVYVNKTGRYLIILNGQAGKTSGTTAINVRLWLRKNGVDVAHSNSVFNVLATTDTSTLICSVVLSLTDGDYVSGVMSVSSTGAGAGLITSAPSGEPVVPSALFTIAEL